MIRLAVIGLGAVTRNIHLPAYARLKEKVRVVAGCDIDAAARSAMAARFPEIYADAEAMIEQAKPDLVVICTPPSLHRAQCLLALDHGCHVFCEKPMAESLADAEAIIQASQRAQRHVVINTQFPYMRTYQAARQMIGTPAFGRLLFMHAWQTFRRTAHTETGWRGQMQRRLCLEFGVHVFELARFFFEDTPSTIFAHMPNPLPDEHADVVNTIALGFPDGRGAAIVLDRLHKGPHRYLELTLDGESASIHTSIGGEVRFEVGIHTQERRPFMGWHFVKGGKAVLQRGNHAKRIAKEDLNPFAGATARHLGQFIEALDTDTEPQASAQDNVITLALVLAAYESAQIGSTIDVHDYLKRHRAVSNRGVPR